MKKLIFLIVSCVFLFVGCAESNFNSTTETFTSNPAMLPIETETSEQEHIDPAPPRMLNFSSMEEWVGLIDSTRLQDSEFTNFIDKHHYSMNGINSKQDVLVLKSRLDTASFPILEELEFSSSTIYMEKHGMDFVLESNDGDWIRFCTYLKGSTELEDAKTFFEEAQSQGYETELDTKSMKLLYSDIEQEQDRHHYLLNTDDAYFNITVYEAEKDVANYRLSNLRFGNFDEFANTYDKETVFIYSDGQSIKPYVHFAYSYDYDEEHGGIFADGVSIDSELPNFADELQTLVFSDDFEVIVGDNQEIADVFVFNDSYERIDDLQTDLSRLPTGTYYVGVLANETGRYIESEQKNEYYGFVNCFKLIVDDANQSTQATEPPGYVEAADIIKKLPVYADKMPNCNTEQLVFTTIKDDAVKEEIKRELGLSMYKAGYYNSDGYILFYEDGLHSNELNLALEQNKFSNNSQSVFVIETGDFEVLTIFTDDKCGDDISNVIYNIIIGRY